MDRTFAHPRFFVIATFLAFAIPDYSQSTETKPVFEGADVHASTPPHNQGLNGPALRGGLYRMRYATMVDLIKTAWNVPAEKVLGGPNWLENDTFDVIAKPPAGTTADTARPMLKALLEERFKLVTHDDTRSVAAYALKAGKHAGLRQSEGTGDAGCKFTPPIPPANGEPLTTALQLSYSCHNMTMAAFAEAMHTFVAAPQLYLNNRVVVDQTELKDAWNFDFKYTPRAMVGPNGPLPGVITLADAMEKLGLKLEPATIPVPVIVVDSVNRKPSPNPENTADVLHIAPGPTEFEVAEIKPTDPEYKGMNLQIQPGGRVNIAGVPLKLLIQQVWDVPDDMMAGVPKWMETARFNIIAKAPATEPDIDIDELLVMLKQLLVERFKIEMHTEVRQATAYTLIAMKPRIKKADPESRTRYTEGPATEGRDPRDKNPVLSRLVTIQNMTTGQFAEKLQRIAPGYIHSPVLDSTGLEGGYDFTLSFSAVGLTRAPGGGGPGRGGAEAGPAGPAEEPGAAAAASDPNGAITLFDAIEKQLGLKLQAQKRAVPILVIDHIEQKPTDN